MPTPDKTPSETKPYARYTHKQRRHDTYAMNMCSRDTENSNTMLIPKLDARATKISLLLLSNNARDVLLHNFDLL